VDNARNQRIKIITYTVDPIPPPNTSITASHVHPRSGAVTIVFKGAGGVGALHFQCKLDTGTWTTCSSPRSYAALRPGSHTIQVRAIDSRGKTDPTPGKRAFSLQTVA
jgi:hypothetical protein